MKFKLGDRVVVKMGRNIGERQLDGSIGIVTSMNNGEDFIGVTLNNKPVDIKIGRIYFSPDELELDKSYIINEILKEI